MHISELLPCPKVAVVVQTCLVIVNTKEEWQNFMACPIGDLAWLYPNCGGKVWHWYVAPVVPIGCTF